ncbi:hypothetical protein VNO78_28936 [Psophocarpus tetragonolobus]|uniref:Uncharacterized protein n=1 Tax=Psophocarpus tetragonolobus TaxID=3891 RepID=A0AAN9WZR5_PSOTE
MVSQLWAPPNLPSKPSNLCEGGAQGGHLRFPAGASEAFVLPPIQSNQNYLVNCWHRCDLAGKPSKKKIIKLNKMPKSTAYFLDRHDQIKNETPHSVK